MACMKSLSVKSDRAAWPILGTLPWPEARSFVESSLTITAGRYNGGDVTFNCVRSVAQTNFSCNAVKHSAKDQPVQGENGVPVSKPQQPYRIERRCLADEGACGITCHFELQPGTAREFHFSRQTQTMIGLHHLHTPEVHSITNAKRIRIAAAASHPKATE